MSRYISKVLREIVAKRAQYRCEYCQIQENRTFYKFQVDHIISVKHGGITEIDNLALACTVCNRNKGSDLGTYIDDKLEELVRFYNPRKDFWSDHFEMLDTGVIAPQTDIGKATEKILGFNHPYSVMERKYVIEFINANFVCP